MANGIFDFLKSAIHAYAYADSCNAFYDALGKNDIPKALRFYNTAVKQGLAIKDKVEYEGDVNPIVHSLFVMKADYGYRSGRITQEKHAEIMRDLGVDGNA